MYGVAKSVLWKLGSLALEEFFLVWGLRSEVEEIKETMVAIKAVLLDADQRGSQDLLIEAWLGELKDVLYDIEDAVDEMECEALRRQVVKAGRRAKQVGRYFSESNPLVVRIRVAHVLKNIRDRLDRIEERRCSLSLGDSSSSDEVNDMPLVRRDRELTHSFVRTEAVIGREDDRESIVNALLEPADGENVCILPIVGIGGLGKTTLAKFVYNDDRVVSCFRRRMWVCVSDEFHSEKLVIQMLESLGFDRKEYEGKHMERLQMVLRETLDGTRYLLVLDDVWNEDSVKWIELKELLLQCGVGSKIIVTTRSHRVASIMGTMAPYKLKDLPHGHCSTLFFRYAFKQETGVQNPELVGIGEDIVKKCKGVPLAIITLATVLYSSTDKRKWESVRDSEIWRVEQGENDILPALKLSYKHLPPHLKRCFAYCSIFPKGYTFDNVELIYFWVANGLVQTSGAHEELEDVGFRYFEELSSRCFFQNFEDDPFFSTCKMHDLIHELALSVSQNEISTMTSSRQKIPGCVRHLSLSYLDSSPGELPRSLKGLTHVRTISFVRETSKRIASTEFIEMCSMMSHLRVLDLTFSEFNKLPDSIGNLKHLRYLSLWQNVHIETLPNSICKLQNLQLLNLGGCDRLEQLPRDIKDLVSLRCLSVTTRQKHLPEGGIGCLESLRSFHILDCDYLERLFEDINGLRRLRRLSIVSCRNLRSLPMSIKGLASLDTLILYWCCKLDLEMENNEHPSRFSLQRLEIIGLPELVQVPEWLLRGSVNSLRILNIARCHNLRHVPEWVKDIPTLEKLSID